MQTTYYDSDYIIGKTNNCPSTVIQSLREQSCWLSSKSWSRQIPYFATNCNFPTLKTQGCGLSSIKGKSSDVWDTDFSINIEHRLVLCM
jgi:hypothetical protein